MSLLGVPLGKPGTPIPQPAPPPVLPSASDGPAPLPAAGSGGGTASASGGGTGAAVASQTPTLVVASTAIMTAAVATGTPITAPATRSAFGQADDSDDASGSYAAQRRRWRLADVLAAIGGGPRAEHLIAAANRPGPVEPGSLTEALKALCPAPALQTSRTV